MSVEPDAVAWLHVGHVEAAAAAAWRDRNPSQRVAAVRVYAGIDPVTEKRHYLTEVIPPELPCSGSSCLPRRGCSRATLMVARGSSRTPWARYERMCAVGLGHEPLHQL